MFIIQDWASNTCFEGISFPSFDDAWAFIREHLNENEDDYDEYFVVEK